MSFVPGHISLTFSVWENKNPIKMGSTGIGLVLPHGVHCAVVKEQYDSLDNKILCDQQNVEDPVTLRALELIGYKDQGLTIYLKRDLPLGFGFGISGASALAACMELENDFNKCVKAAHHSEVEFKTGLGDVMSISTALKNNHYPSIVVRHEPGFGGNVSTHKIDGKVLVCISGFGRDTSNILNNSKWIEIINTVASGIRLSNPNIRSAIKAGRLFTEKTGLMEPNLADILNEVSIGSVASIAHLGTSIVATSDDLSGLKHTLEKYGEIKEF